MVARWASFAVGLWLILAPLVLGYDEVGAVLHEVAIGLAVCVGTLAALEWPAARYGQLAPALWLLAAPRVLAFESARVGANELAAGAVLAVLAVIPGGRLAQRSGPVLRPPANASRAA
jgi:hypothetical protein